MLEGALTKGKAITYASFGFLAGTGLFSFIQTSSYWFCFLVAAVFLMTILILKAKRILYVNIFCVIMIGFALAGGRYDLSYPKIGSDHISYYNGRSLSFSGNVSKEPVEKTAGWQLTIEVDSAIMKASAPKPLHGKVLMTVALLPIYNYGDQLSIICKLEKPINKDFPYDRYLARYGIYSLCNRPKIKLLETNKASPTMAWLLEIKKSCYEIAGRYMPEPTALLALPVVFGGGQGIDDAIVNDFRRTGLTHIMAVSGFNVSLLAVLLGFCFTLLGLNRRRAFYATSLVICAYVAMVGAPASAVRAGVMSIFLLLALTVGRLASLPRSVLLVAVTTLLINPRLLRDDIGWQLSFLALLGLMYILPYLEKWTLVLTKNRGKNFITALMATVAAQIATAPIILYNFGNFSIIAPIANLLVVWVVPILTVAMMIALPLAALFPGLGTLLFFPSWVMVKYIFFVVQLLSRLPWAAVEKI